MKILMIGRGVVATLYGWALDGAGHQVDFYVRLGRAAEYGSTVELNIYDLRQKDAESQRVRQTWTLSLREDLPEDHDYDVILVSLTHYRVPEAVKFLSSRAGNATIIMFNNMWEDPQTATAALPLAQIAWGFPGVGGGYQPNGELLAALFPKVEFGTFETEPTERERAAQKLFTDAGFTIAEQRDFRGWLLTHFAISAAVTAQQFDAGSTRREVYWNRDHGMEKAIRNIREVKPLLAARGVKVEGQQELAMFEQPEAKVVETMAPMLNSPGFQIAVDGHANLQELRRMFEDVLADGRRLGIPLPAFEAAARAQERSTSA